jgi:hypothetical protein
MKKLFIYTYIFAIWMFFCCSISFAKVVQNIPVWDNITKISINPIWWDNMLSQINNLWFSLLHTVKVILWWVILIYLIYIWINMIVSMWSDDKTKNLKNKLYYTLVAFLFINIPGQIYSLFIWRQRDATEITHDFTDVTETKWNMFVNFESWDSIVGDWLIPFVKILIAWVVVIMLIIAWINMIMARWDTEKNKKAKNRFLYAWFWLIFLWVIESWVRFVYTWDIKQWQWIFAQLMNIAIFFAWPTVIFFLILWWFYYITSAWDENKAKKWIAILKNTVLATLILLACYTFLLDLISFTL